MKDNVTEKEIRDAITFLDRLTVLKSNRHHRIIAYGGGYERRPREHFVDYALRVRAGFPKDHKLPAARLRKGIPDVVMLPAPRRKR